MAWTGARSAVRSGAFAGLLGAACSSGPVPERAALTDLGPSIAVQVGGEPFAEYRRDSGRRPAIWPLRAPGGIAVTRAFPFQGVAGEPQDHPWQESLWFAHGAVNGIDFQQGAGRIVEQELQIDAAAGELRGVASWRGPDGRELCRDFHRWSFCGGDGWRAVDLDLTLVASAGPLQLGESKDGTLMLRLVPELALRGPTATGTLVDSEGRSGAQVFGQRARWVAFAGTVDGAAIVVAVFDHPDNPGHPAVWQPRDYGLLAVNPFGRSDVAGSAGGLGPLQLDAGAQLRMRYRVHVGRGGDRLAKLPAAYADWLAGR